MFTTSEYLYLFGARDPYDSIRASAFLSLVLLVFLARKNHRFFTLLFHINMQIHRTSKLAAAVVEPEIKYVLFIFCKIKILNYLFSFVTMEFFVL